jgi:hypothetical protein
MENMQSLKKDYPWIQTPLVVGAPMRLIALADMAVEISKAGRYAHAYHLFPVFPSLTTSRVYFFNPRAIVYPLYFIY